MFNCQILNVDFRIADPKKYVIGTLSRKSSSNSDVCIQSLFAYLECCLMHRGHVYIIVCFDLITDIPVNKFSLMLECFLSC